MNKTYSFNINKTKKNNNKNYKFFTSDTFSEVLDNIISSNVIKNNPWMADLFGTTKKDDHIIVINNTKKKDVTYGYGDFIKAMDYLSSLNLYNDTYDYELSDGTPVKIFDNEIQIGYDLIPLNSSYTYSSYLNLTPTTKKTIIDIYFSIRK